MDHTSHIVTIDPGCAPATEIDVIAYVARYKGLTVNWSNLSPAPLGEPRPLAIQLRYVTVHNFWPCFEFLNDIYRIPEVLTDTPEGRAAIRSVAEHLLRGRVRSNEIAARYMEPDGSLRLPIRPNLIDLIVATVDRISPYAQRLRHHLDTLIQPMEGTALGSH